MPLQTRSSILHWLKAGYSQRVVADAHRVSRSTVQCIAATAKEGRAELTRAQDADLAAARQLSERYCRSRQSEA